MSFHLKDYSQHPLNRPLSKITQPLLLITIQLSLYCYMDPPMYFYYKLTQYYLTTIQVVGVVGTILVGTTIVNKSYVIKIIRPLPTYVASPVVSSMIRNQSANKIIRSGLQPVASSTLHIQTQTWFNLVKTHTINISDLRCRSSGVIRTWMHLPGSPNSRGPLIFPLLAKRFILEVGPDSSLDSELKCILDTVKVNSGMTVIPDQRVSIEPDSTESNFKR
ncbi:hypothetical protein BATDEDRAFT_21459 [Batrachochytrium dendrobatidis JAM81]|uniref:Uncharacterized protein n=1 Tax=Batrachochytrium dendrobatidis (strain JAM81 / FGSC 10211) TaxID=684364 RepID=F4NT76_BATDJ|nr:uncharacterized protein BATDEDRAFT_21459 [Batrachochytrium dendrobatidis JAM81]EGF83093.1 hypothetical protein BATDEDRAFT_21459 [Batrachochytrium dendrobatidis JAM81]|eukprot:XP_006675293.1 hypothetical protein BATDEDRAFT_21459 [Batrachochytrium dendrobatidis JAM81]